MTALVLDASVALSWCFIDEASAETDELMRLVERSGAIVPQLWHLEVANILRIAEKRGRISREDLDDRLRFLSSLPIRTDSATHELAWSDILPLARAEGLTTYDAAYLELALLLALPLATRDRDLRLAAGRRSIPLIAT